jgi:hypothetical protein
LQQLSWPGHVIGDGEKKITRMRNMKFWQDTIHHQTAAAAAE